MPHKAHHHSVSITRGSEDLFLIQSVSAGVTSLAPWLSRRLACSLAALSSPQNPPSLYSPCCVSVIMGPVGLGVMFVGLFVRMLEGGFQSQWERVGVSTSRSIACVRTHSFLKFCMKWNYHQWSLYFFTFSSVLVSTDCGESGSYASKCSSILTI